MKAITAIVQSRVCMFLMKSIAFSSPASVSSGAAPQKRAKMSATENNSMPHEPTPEQPSGGDAEQAVEAGNQRSRKRRAGAGMAFGIGSAALVAALLYANRPRKKNERR